jgi:transcriptional regulator with XRE-family HTH domain
MTVTGIRHTGIAIVPAQLTRMRDLRALSVEGLAERTGERLFDYDLFAAILDGKARADAQMARALWKALDCTPAEIIRGLPRVELSERTGTWRVATSGVSLTRWLHRSDDWSLDTGAVARLAAARGMSLLPGLAEAASRHWFSRDSVAKIERGERRPKPRTLEAFCEILGCVPADLMPGSRPLPDGRTRDHRELLDWNRGMREYADAHGISYRNASGRIRYPDRLQEEYASYMALRGRALAS